MSYIEVFLFIAIPLNVVTCRTSNSEFEYLLSEDCLKGLEIYSIFFYMVCIQDFVI